MSALISELLLGGLRFPEAPRWHDGELWFADMLGRQVLRVNTFGTVSPVAEFDDIPGGLGFLPDGTLIVAGMHSGKVFAVIGGKSSEYADLSGIANGHLDDMVVAPDGTAYIGGIGLNVGGVPPTNGCIMRVTPSGECVLEESGVPFPNGAAITPDGKQLLFAETFGACIAGWGIRDDGSLANRQRWAELPNLHPDGLCIDASGAVWSGCFAESKFVRVEAGGHITDTIKVGTHWATGVELGGDDGHTLFLCISDTDEKRYFEEESSGRIDTVRVDVGRVPA